MKETDEKKIRSVGAINKQKGSNAERYYAKKFRELGFEFCKTSREASKHLDNAKVDLINIPFNIQVKAGKQKNMNPGKELLLMESCIKSMFPKDDSIHTKPLLLFHYQEVGRGNKRASESETVYMSRIQFEKFKLKNKDLIFFGSKELKFESSSEFKVIVNMTFEYFKSNIIIKLYANNNTSE